MHAQSLVTVPLEVVRHYLSLEGGHEVEMSRRQARLFQARMRL